MEIDKLVLMAGILVVIVNIITEVVKNLSDKLKTSKVINVFVLIISVILTVGAYLFYTHFSGVTVDAYGVIASVIGGFLVAFGAMFGFDKLLVYIEPYLKKDDAQ